MGSASGWPGRAWTPLRVIHSGRWRCMGAPPLGPGCILAFHPPVAPCCCAGSSSAGALPALAGQPSCWGGGHTAAGCEDGGWGVAFLLGFWRASYI